MSERITRTRVDWNKYADNTTPKETRNVVPEHETLLQFETENAVYHFHPGRHSKATDLPTSILDSADAIIIEENFTTYEALLLDDFYQIPQFEGLIDETLAETELSFFLLDLPSIFDNANMDHSKFKRDLSVFLIIPPLIVVALAFVHPLLALIGCFIALPSFLMLFEVGVKDKLGLNVPDETTSLRAYMVFPWFYTVWGGRSALVAQKLERFVAPKLTNELGRKPEILIDYGSFHVDMYLYLQSSPLRHALLAFHNWRDWWHLDETYVDRICEYQASSVEPMFRNQMENRNQQYKKLIYELQGDIIP